MNRVTLIGNLTREIELRRTQSGTAVMNLGMAVNNRRKNPQTGEWEDEPCYVDCVMFGTRAESVSNYLHKGSKIGIDGKLRYSQWEARGGSGKRSKLEVLVDDIELLTPRGQNGAQGGYNGGYQQQAGGYNPQAQSAPQNAPQQPHGGYQQAPQQAYQQPAQQQAQQPELTPSVYDDDIPFGG